MANIRKYTYEIVLKVDDEKYQDYYKNILLNFDAIWCTQDKDVYESDLYDDDNNLIHEAGDPKYDHTHFLIKMRTAKTISAVAKIIGCKETDINYINKSFNSALTYLIHWGRTDKFNYSPDEVQSNSDELMNKFKKLINESKDMNDRVQPIFSYIDECDYLSYNQFIKYIYSSRQWNTFRANASIFTMYLDEHNRMYNNYHYKVLNNISIKNKHKNKNKI